MPEDYGRCGGCGANVLFQDSANQGKFPVTRRFQDQAREEGLLAVRCRECSSLPFSLSEGEASRVSHVGGEPARIITDFASQYNYWPREIGHLLEVYSSEPSAEKSEAFRSGETRLGYLYEEEHNLIVLGYFTGGADHWNVTPYSWHHHRDFTRAVPPHDCASPEDRAFHLTLVDTHGGKIAASRRGTLPLPFAESFNSTIRKQIEQPPPDPDRYRARVTHLYDLLLGDKLARQLEAVCTLE